MPSLTTERLELVPATVGLARAGLEGPEALGRLLQAEIPATWPPQYLEPPAFEYTIARLQEEPVQPAWWMYFVVLREGRRRILIGSAGYKGPPDADGTVEIGYGIVSERHRQGFASEAAGGLLEHAFADRRVARVIAETLPELAGSIGVLRRCGFRGIGAGSEPGVIRFELRREEYRPATAAPAPPAR